MPSSGQKPDAQSVAVRQMAHTARPVEPELDADAALEDEDDEAEEDEAALDDALEAALLAVWPGHDDTLKPPDSGTQTRSVQLKLMSQSATVWQVFEQSSWGALEQAAPSASSAARARVLANMRGT